MRECIIETKWKYDVASEDKQVAWKALILNFMERYFYLICFATYALEHGPTGYQKSFVSWMDEHQDLRTMIGEETVRVRVGPGSDRFHNHGEGPYWVLLLLENAN